MARPARDVVAAKDDPPARRAVHARDGADERGLARAVGADDRDDRPFVDLERDAVERLRVAVKDVEALDREHQASASSPR